MLTSIKVRIIFSLKYLIILYVKTDSNKELHQARVLHYTPTASAQGPPPASVLLQSSLTQKSKLIVEYTT